MDNLKAKLIKVLNGVGDFMLFSWDTLKFTPSNLRHPMEIIRQIWSIGIKSLALVVPTGFFIGMILGLQGGQAAESLVPGTAFFVSGALSVTLVKELGPVLTAMILVSRICSSVTAQIGTMKVTEQIDALRTLSVNPIEHLVTPRVIAGMIVVPFLGFISIFMSMLGVYLMVTLLYMVDTNTFLEWAQMPMQLTFVWEAIVKMIFFGNSLLLLSTYYGFKTRGGAAGVGEATITSVVMNSFMIFVLDYFIGAIFMVVGGGGK